MYTKSQTVRTNCPSTSCETPQSLTVVVIFRILRLKLMEVLKASVLVDDYFSYEASMEAMFKYTGNPGPWITIHRRQSLHSHASPGRAQGARLMNMHDDVTVYQLRSSQICVWPRADQVG